jgi:hypothetical protein
MSLKELADLPPGVAAAAESIAALDRCFLVGFGRLGPEQLQALQSLGRIFAGTPLDKPVADALAAVGRNEFVDRHFAVLAAARAAMQAAQYDALRAQAAKALGRKIGEKPPEKSPSAPADAAGSLAVWQESSRNWLMELALAGFQQLEESTLAPFVATLEHLQGEPRATRLASVLTGFLRELLDALPVASLPEVPVYRWVDLWTRAFLASVNPPAPPAGRKVSGTLTVLGVDLRQHGYFVSFDCYALLENQTKQIVRVTRSSYKVDVVVGPDVWKCFFKKSEPLLQGISEHAVLKVTDMTLLPTGDLLWDGKATAGKPADVMAVAAGLLAPDAAEPLGLPEVAPVDRHPVQLAEAVHLTEYQFHDGKPPTLGLDGVELPLAVTRLSSASELTIEHVGNSSALLGLLRFDGGHWSVQPLAVALAGKKGGAQYTGSGAVAAIAPKKKGDVLAILQERASRLLRKKS